MLMAAWGTELQFDSQPRISVPRLHSLSSNAFVLRFQRAELVATDSAQ